MGINRNKKEDFKKMAAHEFGHAAFSLRDVYKYSKPPKSLMNDHNAGRQEVDFAMMFSGPAFGGDKSKYVAIIYYYKYHGGN